MSMTLYVRRPPLVGVLVILFFSVQARSSATVNASEGPENSSGIASLGIEQQRIYLLKAEAWCKSQEGYASGKEIKPAEMTKALMQMAKTEKLEKHFEESQNLMKSAINLAEQYGFSEYLLGSYYFQLSTLYSFTEERGKAIVALEKACQLSKESGNEALITACRITMDDLRTAGTSAVGEQMGMPLQENRRGTQGVAPATNTKAWGVLVSLLLLVGGVLFGKWQLARNKPLVNAEKTVPIEETREKPVPDSQAVIEKESTEGNNPKKSVWIREKNKRWIHIDVAEIVCIEAKNNNVDMHTLSKTYKEIGVSLLNMSRQLDKSAFIRTHRSFLVNTEHLKMIEDNNLFLTKGKAPIGESYRKNLFDTLHLLRSTCQKTQDTPTLESLQHA